MATIVQATMTESRSVVFNVSTLRSGLFGKSRYGRTLGIFLNAFQIPLLRSHIIRREASAELRAASDLTRT